MARELTDGRYSLHSNSYSRASPTHGDAMSHIPTLRQLNIGTNWSEQLHDTEHHNPQYRPTDPPHSSPGYYGPDDSIAKQVYAQQFKRSPYRISPSDVSEDFTKKNRSLSYDRNSGSPQFGELPGYSPPQGYEIGPTKYSKSPMKANRDSLQSSSHTSVENTGKFNPQTSNATLQSLRNSSGSPEPRIGENLYNAELNPLHLSQDATITKMGRHFINESPASSTKRGKSRVSRQGDPPEISAENGYPPELMRKSIRPPTTTGKKSKKSLAPSSRSSLLEQGVSPELREAYHRHLEATGKRLGSEHSSRTSSRMSSSRKSSEDDGSDSPSESTRYSSKIQTYNRRKSGKTFEKPASSVRISRDSSLINRGRSKPIAMETRVGMETGNVLHSNQDKTYPYPRSSIPKHMSSEFAMDPHDFMGNSGSGAAPTSNSSLGHPRSRHSRTRMSAPNDIDPLVTMQPENSIDTLNYKLGTHTRHSDQSFRPQPSNLVDSFSSGAVPRMHTPTSHKSKSYSSTPYVDIKRDSRGPSVPRKMVPLQEQTYRRPRHKSSDSGSSERSQLYHEDDFKTASPSNAELHRINYQREAKEFDTFSHIFAANPDKSRHQTTHKSKIQSQVSRSTDASYKVKSRDQSLMSNAGPVSKTRDPNFERKINYRDQFSKSDVTPTLNEQHSTTNEFSWGSTRQMSSPGRRTPQPRRSRAPKSQVSTRTKRRKKVNTEKESVDVSSDNSDTESTDSESSNYDMDDDNSIAVFDKDSGHMYRYDPVENEMTEMHEFNIVMKENPFLATAVDHQIYVVVNSQKMYSLNYREESATWKRTKFPKNFPLQITTALSNSKKLFLRGWRRNGPGESVAMYYPKKNKWKMVTDKTKATVSSAIVATNEFIYCFGGWIEGEETDFVQRLDLKSLTWSLLAPMRKPMGNASAVECRGNIFLFDSKGSRSLDLFNPDTEEWSQLASMDHHYYLNLATLPFFAACGHIYIFRKDFKDKWIVKKYNIDDDRWESIKELQNNYICATPISV